MSVNSYTIPISQEQADLLKETLAQRGMEFSEKPYAQFSAKAPNLSVTVYEKGPKVLIQGKRTEEFIQFTLEPEILKEIVFGHEEINQSEQFEPHFGIDESGKGDYFGPLVVAGVYTDKWSARPLMDAGIMDSKRIGTSKKIRELAERIRTTPGVVYEVVSMGPEKYNELHARFKNLNRLLAWGHARVIKKLSEKRPDCPMSLSDQFARRKEVLESAVQYQKVDIRVEQRTKAESDVAVAAASILARERFVTWMEQASKAGGVRLPLGASPKVITAAKEVVKVHGEPMLGKLAKLHFKTTQKVIT